MVFDVDDILKSGLDFDLSVKCDHFKFQQVDGHINEKVTIQGTLTRLNQEIYLRGIINTGLKVNCSRCLDRIDFRLHVKLFARFIPRGTLNVSTSEYEIHESDIETEYYSENRIDITHAVYDTILLSLPMVSLCSDDCLGLCGVCGKNINLDPCKCSKQQDVDPRLEILKRLK